MIDAKLCLLSILKTENISIIISARRIEFDLKPIELLGDVLTKKKFKKEIEKLFSLSNISEQKYTSKLIEELPEPVQRYFRYSLTENQSFISYVRLLHRGEFRPKDSWVNIKGEEYFTTQKPGFIWIGKTALFLAKDSYIGGIGNLKVKLLSLIKIVDGKGEEFNQGELLRWLGEAPLFPTALLPSDNLRWEPIDSNSAKAILTDHNITVESVFFFNEEGQITQFKSKRYYETTLENWTGYYRDYREIKGMRIPFDVEVEWNLESGDYKYVKFKIESIEYDVPLKY